jgi:hypothetical protein
MLPARSGTSSSPVNDPAGRLSWSPQRAGARAPGGRADLERQQFGRDEFGAMVARVGHIEHNLGIYDLGQFTPEVGPFLPGS